MDQTLLSLYDKLLIKHGDPSELWPQWCDQNKDEKLRQLVTIGAILTQRTSWRNADLALRNLKRVNLLSLESLSKINDPSVLAEHTHPAGFHQTKPKRLTQFAKFVVEHYGSLTNMKKSDMKSLRSELLDVYGIGPETADTMLLYALNQPSFVIDAYTRSWLKERNVPYHNNSYDEIKAVFESALPQNVEIYQNYHILIIVDQKGRELSKMEIV